MSNETIYVVYIMEGGSIFDIAGEFNTLEDARKYKMELDLEYPYYEACAIYVRTEERLE